MGNGFREIWIEYLWIQQSCRFRFQWRRVLNFSRTFTYFSKTLNTCLHRMGNVFELLELFIYFAKTFNRACTEWEMFFIKFESNICKFSKAVTNQFSKNREKFQWSFLKLFRNFYILWKTLNTCLHRMGNKFELLELFTHVSKTLNTCLHRMGNKFEICC